MKITVNREKFVKGLQKVSSIIGSRSMLPVLGNVLLEASENKLSLTATDLEIRVATSLECTVETPGATTIPGKRLLSLFSGFTAEAIEFSSNENDHVAVVCGTANFTLLGLPAADFPVADEWAVMRSVGIGENEFKRAVANVAYSVSTDDSRKVLTGVLLAVREGTLTLVATDGRRLALIERTPERIEGGDGEAIIPLKAANEVRRLLSGSGTLNIEVGEKQCRFTAEGFTLTTKLIEGNYPNYRQVIPASFAQQLDAPCADLLVKVETVSQVLSDSSAYVILNFADNALQIKASSSEIGNGSDMVVIEYAGDPLEVSFNPGFLADPLRCCAADKIKFKIKDSTSPVAMDCGDGFLYVIMPIRKK